MKTKQFKWLAATLMLVAAIRSGNADKRFSLPEEMIMEIERICQG